MKSIKNYTSKVPFERTIGQIESLLASIGANKIEKSYGEGKPNGIKFEIELNSRQIKFEIPLKIEEVKKILRETYRTRPKTWVEDQTMRTAWRITFDWVASQVVMIQLRQVEIVQVFLPYVINQKTGLPLYGMIMSSGMIDGEVK